MADVANEMRISGSLPAAGKPLPDDLIRGIPKAELHIHIEGSLEPEMMFEIGRRNGIEMPYKTPDEVRQAYKFTDLQSFLDIYYRGAEVLIEEVDFYDMTMAYLRRASSEGVVHVEIFFDPQTHTSRGISMETVVSGISRATDVAAKEMGMSCQLIMCFLRHLDEESAMSALEAALRFKSKITAVGLDSSEKGNPPEKFQRVYERAIAEGFLAVAHAGEEGPPEYIWASLKHLHVKRIDHGIRCLEDQTLVEHLVKEKIPLTVCPLSNIKLKVFNDIKDHPLKKMLDMGLVVTANSDDPAYFGGYIADNFAAVHRGLDMSMEDLLQLAENSFHASFLSPDIRDSFLTQLQNYRLKLAPKQQEETTLTSAAEGKEDATRELQGSGEGAVRKSLLSHCFSCVSSKPMPKRVSRLPC